MGQVLTQVAPWPRANQVQLARIEQESREEILADGVVSLLRAAALPDVINLRSEDIARIRQIISNK